MIYNLVNTQVLENNDVSLNDIMNISKAHSKNNSLSAQICDLIWADWGYSLVFDGSSGGIPSPVRESETFKKLFEYKDDELGSSFNSRKIKKIEFSDDSLTKKWTPKSSKKSKVHKKSAPSEPEDNGEFTHTSIDRMVFGSDDPLKASIATSRRRRPEIEVVSDKSFDSVSNLTWDHLFNQSVNSYTPKKWEIIIPDEDPYISPSEISLASEHFEKERTIKKVDLKGVIENSSNCGISNNAS